MLKQLQEPGADEKQRPGDGGGLSAAGGLDFERVLAILRRQAPVIGGAVALAFVLGIVFILVVAPKYTSSTDLLIDGKRNNSRADVASSLAEMSFDTSAIDSQVEVLKSEKIALAVIRKLGLLDDPEFMQPGWGLISAVLGPVSSMLGLPEPTPEEIRFKAERNAIAVLGKELDVKRVARTFVLTISYRGTSAKQAASISSAFAEAYLDDQLESRYETSRRASEWLLSRIAELRKKSLETDKAVQNFKAANQIAVNGSGQLVNEQQLGETNIRLITARTEVARARSKYERVQLIIKSKQTDAAVSEVLINPVIVDLRNKMLRVAKTMAEITTKLGPSHVQAINLRAEVAEYERLIFEEVGRIAESYKSELDIALANEVATETDLKKQMSESGTTNQVLVVLRELEREADSYKSLYQTFLQRYQETVQSLSFPINDARIITVATPSLRPSHPKKPLVLGLALIAGLGLGGGLAAMRELRDRGFRTGGQIREELGLEFLGMLSNIRLLEGEAPEVDADGTPSPKFNEHVNAYVLHEPLSSFAETLRAAKVAIDISLRDQKSKVIGLVSVLPGEGKSTVSKNLASLIAQSGFSTLLIDGDLRNPNLTRSLVPNATQGLLELLLDNRTVENVLIKEPESGLMLLPTVKSRRVTHSGDLLSSVRMRQIIDKARQGFDYVIIDLPPLGPIVDVRAAQSMFDAFIFVIEWGETSRSVVRSTFESDGDIYDKTVGVILNKVDPEGLRLYEGHGSKEYYSDSYKNYYTKTSSE
jgi:succinoglycan biosynthesis transport protein ExoP